MRHFMTNGRKRNMLLSSNDFGYIFETGDGLDQKVSTALMMIEKDYLFKTRFNVLIARPKGCLPASMHVQTRSEYRDLKRNMEIVSV